MQSLASTVLALAFFVGKASACADTDNGATDSNGAACSGYNAGNAWYMCSYYDDTDFTSCDMCCICADEHACNHMSQACEDKIVEHFFATILTFSAVGAVLAIAGIVLGCLPTCCGKMIEKAKPFGIIAMVLSLIGMIMPAIAGKVAIDSSIDKVCEDKGCNPNGCDQDEIDEEKDALAALGIVLAYTVGHGYLPLILGIIGMAMGGAACCKCCKAKGEPAGGDVVVATAAVAK